MRKFSKIGLLVLAVLLLLPGCRKEEAPKEVVLVTKITVICRQEGDVLARHYTDPQKMDAILHYLLRLKPYGFAERDPESVRGPAIEIQTDLSDGSRHIYRQRADRYFSKDSQAWELIDPKRAAMLYPLLEQMESDSS